MISFITPLCATPKQVVLKMPSILPNPTATSNKFEDLSGIDAAAYENPYDALIEACNNDPVRSLSSSQYASQTCYCYLKYLYSCKPPCVSKLSPLRPESWMLTPPSLPRPSSNPAIRLIVLPATASKKPNCYPLISLAYLSTLFSRS